MSYLRAHLLHDGPGHLVAPLVIAAQLVQHVPRVREEPPRQRPPAADALCARREPAAESSVKNAFKLK